MKKIIKNILSIIVIGLIIITLLEVIKINVLPDKYLYILIGIEAALFLIGLILYNNKKVLPVIFGILFYIASILSNVVGYYYLSVTNKYLKANFEINTYPIETEYYLVTNTTNTINSINDLNSDSIIFYYKYSRSIMKALKEIGKYNYQSSQNGFETLSKVLNNGGYFLIPSASFNYIIESSKFLEKNQFKILNTYTIKDEVPVNKGVSDTYNIYINGLDLTGIMRDFNLIATINTKTRKVVLTSIPRDYYIDIPAYNMKDTLMCMGTFDSQVTEEALENLFDIEIDYVVNVNANSLVQIVNTLGGVEICSDGNSTIGMVPGVSKGCHTYNGDDTLKIARYRMTLPGRDRSRQKNMRYILLQIVKKIASITTLTNYNEVLNSFNGLYTTNMNKETLTNLIKVALEDYNFQIIEQSVDGTDTVGIGHLGTQEAWNMIPDMTTVENASKKIKEVQTEKKEK